MITVIIPTYKPDRYIYECLSSVINQDIDTQNYNVLIVLNGDKEPYYSLILNYIKNLSNFKLYYVPRKGVSNARNYALEIIKEGYVVFVDDDDKVSPNYLSGLLKMINNSSLSISNCRSFYNDSSLMKNHLSHVFERLKKQKKPKISIVSCRSFFSTAGFKMIPMNIIGTRRFDTNFKNGEDALFMALISDKVESIRFADEDIIYYRRIRENSASQRKRNFVSKLNNSIRLFWTYMRIYMSAPFKYNFLFFLNRFMAVFKVLFVKEF